MTKIKRIMYKALSLGNLIPLNIYWSCIFMQSITLISELCSESIGRFSYGLNPELLLDRYISNLKPSKKIQYIYLMVKNKCSKQLFLHRFFVSLRLEINSFYSVLISQKLHINKLKTKITNNS
jgi:hypothetical protein